jgi:hypothetical protein
MLLLVSVALAHPGTLPHVHETDPAALGVLAFWALAGVGLGAWVLRRDASEAGRRGQAPAGS